MTPLLRNAGGGAYSKVKTGARARRLSARVDALQPNRHLIVSATRSALATIVNVGFL